MLGRVHVEDRTCQHRLAVLADRIVDQCAPSGAEATRVAAEVPDVLVAADGPEARRTLVHRILGTQPRQDLVVVVPDEERGIPWVDRRVRPQTGRRIDPHIVALVTGHGAFEL